MKKRKLASRESVPAHLRPTPVSKWSEPEEDTSTDEEREADEEREYEEIMAEIEENNKRLQPLLEQIRNGTAQGKISY